MILLNLLPDNCPSVVVPRGAFWDLAARAASGRFPGAGALAFVLLSAAVVAAETVYIFKRIFSGSDACCMLQVAGPWNNVSFPRRRESSSFDPHPCRDKLLTFNI